MCERFPGFLNDWNGDGIIARTGNEKDYRRLLRLNISIVKAKGDGKNRLGHAFCEKYFDRMAARRSKTSNF